MDLETQINEETPEALSNEGILYIISTPIGNDEDISIRALKAIRGSNLIVCEEGKVGGRFLHKHSITQKMELLNENNEIEKTYEILKLLKLGKRVSLVSDCGTPVFADPGLLLVQECIKNDIEIKAIPGASSIMTALVVSGFPINSFFYAGFMSREKSIRLNQITELAHNPHTVALLETPYRLMPLLEAFIKIIPKRRAFIGCNLTMPYETHHYGTFMELYEKFSEQKFKGEFIIVFEGNADSSTILVPESSSIENAFYERNDRDGRSERKGGNYKSKDSYPAKGRKPFSDRKPYSDRKGSDDKRGGFDRKPYSDRKGSDDKRGGFDRKPYSDRKGSDDKRGGFDRKPYSDRKGSDDKRGGFDRKPYSDRKGSDDKRGGFDRKPPKRAPRTNR